MTTLFIFIVMTGLGLTFGLMLAIANNKLAVEVDPRIYEVDDILPKGQCGACGFAGCLGYADAVVKNPDVPVNLCAPGKEEVARKIATITGKAQSSIEKKVASIKCAGTLDKAVRNFEYVGIQGCVSANLLQGGSKVCKYGCLGYGTCVKACPFHAMRMSPEGLPLINPEKCTGCGKCVSACPRHIIELIDPESMVRVNCSSFDKPSVSRQVCQVSCIGCAQCAKQCSHQAIKIENNLAIIDKTICIEECYDPVCLSKCPTKAIRPLIFGLLPGTENENSDNFIYKGYEQSGIYYF
jgi:RnfABCDGE-type electron transport complex B subunit